MRKGIPRAATAVSALMILLIPLAPASAAPYATTVVYQASGTPSPPANGNSPFASCDISGFLIPGETNYVNTELEPWVAVNPTNPLNIIGVYQQDRYTLGGARGLAAAVTHNGGTTWSSTYPHFSSCAGGTEANGGDFQRASDPWVTFSPNGDAYFISLSLTFLGPVSTTGSGVLVSKSTDGGDTWNNPVTLVRNTGDADVAPFFFNDKESITADPFNSNYVYAVWDRLRKPGEAESVNAEHSFAFRGDTLFSRTTNGGQTWEPPRASFGSEKVKSNFHSTIVFTESTDGGLTWSPLSRIDQSPGDVQAFTPSVHVASDGTVGVTYYDFRSNTVAPGLPTDQWFIHCHATTDCTNPTNWAENHVSGPFDIENAATAGGYFLGDYEGLDSIGTTFASFFSQTTASDKDNTYLARIAP